MKNDFAIFARIWRTVVDKTTARNVKWHGAAQSTLIPWLVRNHHISRVTYNAAPAGVSISSNEDKATSVPWALKLSVDSSNMRWCIASTLPWQSYRGKHDYSIFNYNFTFTYRWDRHENRNEEQELRDFDINEKFRILVEFVTANFCRRNTRYDRRS